MASTTEQHKDTKHACAVIPSSQCAIHAILNLAYLVWAQIIECLLEQHNVFVIMAIMILEPLLAQV